MHPVLVAFQDTDLGRFTAITFHTIGALGLVGALMAYGAWYRHLPTGQTRPRSLATALVLTYVAAVVNLAGGFMRTYQEGHPGLSELGTSAWVQVMLLKHLFIFAAIGALLWLIHVQAPRLEAAVAGGRLYKAPVVGHQLGVFVTATGIVVATLLGALGQVTELDDEPMGDDPGPTAATPPREHWINFSSTVTSTPLTPGEAQGGFDVPAGMATLRAALSWNDPVADLALELEAQDADRRGGRGGRFTGEAGVVQGTVDAPDPGRWAYRVSGENAINVAWQLRIHMVPSLDNFTTELTETVAIAEGQFFEINTQMANNTTIAWDWYIWEEEAVHFDVHSHFDGEVQYHLEGHFSEHRGNYTNDREGGHSLLWENTDDDGSGPVTLTYRVWGDFEVDSYFPPR